MQKVINIFVLIVFLISFIGVNIQKHYSQGKLYSIAIFQEAESCCADMENCEMTNASKPSEYHHKDDYSCEDKTETFKISDVFVSEKFSMLNVNTFNLLYTSLFQTVEINLHFISLENTNLTILPPLIEINTQSQFGVFII